MDQGTRLHAVSDSLVLIKDKVELKRFRTEEFSQIQLFGRIECTSSAIALLAKKNVDILFLTRMGSFRFRLASKSGTHAALKISQLKSAASIPFAVKIASAIVKSKILQQRAFLLRHQLKLKDEAIADALARIRTLAEQLSSATAIDTILGFEGFAASLYFSHFHKLIANPDLPFNGRSRRPPLDPVNACLSFAYTMFQYVIESELFIRGLEPSIGFLHQPLANRPSLALDILEEFRPLLDSFVLRLINRGQLTSLDFEYHSGKSLDEILAEEFDSAQDDSNIQGCFLNANGRKIFLAAFYSRLRETMFFNPRQVSLDVRGIVREQVQHLARVIENKELVYIPFTP